MTEKEAPIEHGLDEMYDEFGKNFSAAGLFKTLTEANELKGTYEKCCSATLPRLSASNDLLSYPTCTEGAIAAATLAGKLEATLFPIGGKFAALQSFDEDGTADTEVDPRLLEIEGELFALFGASTIKKLTHQIIESQVVVGDSVIWQDPDSLDARLYKWDKYGASYDAQGELIYLVVADCTVSDYLPMNVKAHIEEHELLIDKVPDGLQVPSSSREDHVVTWQLINRLPNGSYGYWIEAGGRPIKSTYKVFEKLIEAPLLHLRGVIHGGHSHGTSLTAMALRLFERATELDEGIDKYNRMALKVIPVIDPLRGLKSETLNTALSSEEDTILSAKEGSVRYLTLDAKSHVVEKVKQSRADISKEIATVFEVFEPQVRQSSSVTAEEIKALTASMQFMRYSLYQSLTLLQEWISHAFLSRIPAWEEVSGNTDLGIVPTGTTALSRVKILEEVQTLMLGMAPLGAEAMAKWIKVPEYMKLLTVGSSITASSIIRTPEEVKALDNEEAQRQASIRNPDQDQQPQ